MFHIVLVEPEIPQNAGNIARTCAATGTHLHFIRPLGFEVTDKYLKRAGLDYWNLVDISYYDSFDELYEKYKGARFFFFTTKGRTVYSNVNYPDNAYIFFGKETKGLPEELLLKYPDRAVRVPMIGDARSLNLSNTVALAAYEVLRQWDFPELQNFGELHRYDWNTGEIKEQ